MFFTFPENAHWNAEQQAVEFGVEIGECRGVVRVPRRVLQRLLLERPTPERCVEAYYLQRTRFESIAGQKLCRRRLTEGRNVEISGRDFALARLLTRMFSDRAWLEAMGLRLDNLAEADGARSHRRCQINFYSRGRRTPCARRVLGSKVWGSY